jgi:hypothetical protein
LIIVGFAPFGRPSGRCISDLPYPSFQSKHTLTPNEEVTTSVSVKLHFTSRHDCLDSDAPRPPGRGRSHRKIQRTFAERMPECRLVPKSETPHSVRDHTQPRADLGEQVTMIALLGRGRVILLSNLNMRTGAQKAPLLSTQMRACCGIAKANAFFIDPVKVATSRDAQMDIAGGQVQYQTGVSVHAIVPCAQRSVARGSSAHGEDTGFQRVEECPRGLVCRFLHWTALSHLHVRRETRENLVIGATA